MDIIIRPAETSDFDSVVHILNQVQTLHVNWRPDIYKESKDFFSLDAFQDALGRETFYVAAYENVQKMWFYRKINQHGIIISSEVQSYE